MEIVLIRGILAPHVELDIEYCIRYVLFLSYLKESVPLKPQASKRSHFGKGLKALLEPFFY